MIKQCRTCLTSTVGENQSCPDCGTPFKIEDMKEENICTCSGIPCTTMFVNGKAECFKCHKTVLEQSNYCICIVPAYRVDGSCAFCGNQILPHQTIPEPNPREYTLTDIARMENEIGELRRLNQSLTDTCNNTWEKLTDASGKYQTTLTLLAQYRSALSKAVDLNAELLEIKAGE